MRRRRLGDVARLGVGLVGLMTTAVLAGERPGERETEIFRAAQSMVPRSAFPVVWVPMQYGTFGTVPALAGLVALRGHRRVGAAVAIAGCSAWVGAKLVKRVVRRGRPADTVAGAAVLGKPEGGLGFPSGHAAVSAAMTSVLAPELGSLASGAATAASIYVAWARMFVGAHLPLDVLGGSAMGLAIGCAVNLALGVGDDDDGEGAPTSPPPRTAMRSRRRRARR
jgi:glycosyltransferase 2 family protein